MGGYCWGMVARVGWLVVVGVGREGGERRESFFIIYKCYFVIIVLYFSVLNKVKGLQAWTNVKF